MHTNMYVFFVAQFATGKKKPQIFPISDYIGQSNKLWSVLAMETQQLKQ